MSRALRYACAGILLVAGCSAPGAEGPATVSAAAGGAQRAEPSTSSPANGKPGAGRANEPARGAARAPAADDPAIALAAGRSISRGRVLDLLLRSRGPEVLEGMIVLEGAKAMVAERGLGVSEAELAAESDRALRRLIDPLADIEAASSEFDRAAAERVLDEVLQDRGISREEYRLGIERNALLRALVDGQVTITEDLLREEFDRVGGERVEIRHIQVPSLREAATVQDKLTGGADFVELARRHSANLISAEAGGLLAPFSAGQDEVPKVIRDAAFRLKPGEVSEALKLGSWYHLIRVERRLPAEGRNFEAMREALARSLRDRLAEKRMQALYAEIFQKAEVRINDQVLKEAFEKRYPQRGR